MKDIPILPWVAVVALRPLPPPAKRWAAGNSANPAQAGVSSAAPGGKLFALPGRNRASMCLLRRHTESPRDSAHPVAVVAVPPMIPVDP